MFEMVGCVLETYMMYSIPNAIRYDTTESNHQNPHKVYSNALPPQPRAWFKA